MGGKTEGGREGGKYITLIKSLQGASATYTKCLNPFRLL